MVLSTSVLCPYFVLPYFLFSTFFVTYEKRLTKKDNKIYWPYQKSNKMENVPDIRKLTREEILHEAQQLSLQLDSHQSTEKLRTKLSKLLMDWLSEISSTFLTNVI